MFPKTPIVAIAAIGILSPGISAHQIGLPDSLCSATATVELIIDSLAFTEGPACDSRGNLYFTEINKQNIWQVTPNDSAFVFRANSNHANGLVFDAQDRLIACERNRITRTDADGSIHILFEGDLVGASNDISLASSGGMFFTSPVSNGDGNVLYLSPDSVLSTSIPGLTGFPNGIEYIEEKQKLYVAISQENQVWVYDIDAEMKGFNKSIFIDNINVPDGFALDEYGNFWMTSNGDSKVYVYNPEGCTLGEIAIEGEKSIENCCFGSTDFKTLYIAANTAVYRLRLNVKGRATTGEVSIRKNQAGDPGFRQALCHRSGRACIYAPDGSYITSVASHACTAAKLSAMWNYCNTEANSVAAGVYIARFLNPGNHRRIKFVAP